MTVQYNVTGAARKRLAVAVSEILGKPVVYADAPTFAYFVGGCEIDRFGTLTCPVDSKRAVSEWLVESLAELGFVADGAESNRLTAEMPLAGFTEQAMENLRRLIASKEALIKKALPTDSLPVNLSHDRLRFPWFPLTGADGETEAYTRFVYALCDTAKHQKRVTAKPAVVENEKFAMRLFLVRLGLIGAEYKLTRKILLRNLTGNSSWKNGPPQR